MPVDFQDIEATEPDYYKTLRQILDTPLDLLMMDLTFSAEIQKFGNTEVVFPNPSFCSILFCWFILLLKLNLNLTHFPVFLFLFPVQVVDLIPNGRNIAVTDENKFDYIRLVAHHRMTSAIRSQIDSFLQGFYDLVPAELISIFSPAELELLVCGLPDVNIDELQQHTDYHQYKASDEQIVWFWETLRSFNREERASFLQFVTGTSKVKQLPFNSIDSQKNYLRRFLFIFVLPALVKFYACNCFVVRWYCIYYYMYYIYLCPYFVLKGATGRIRESSGNARQPALLHSQGLWRWRSAPQRTHMLQSSEFCIGVFIIIICSNYAEFIIRTHANNFHTSQKKTYGSSPRLHNRLCRRYR